jgi:hypothetical protein
MKRAHTFLLSVLLFVFTFFVFHDYVMVDVDADTQYELYYAQGDEMVLDLPSLIHAHIHILLDVPKPEIAFNLSNLTSAEPFSLQSVPESTTLSVPQRPPLA